MKRYIIVVLALFFIMMLGIVLIAGRSSNESDERDESTQITEQKQLYDYASSSAARVVFTTQGKVVGEDQHRSVRITVTRDYRRIEVLDGYTGRVEKSQRFTNNEAAFYTFLRSLNHEGFMNTRESRIASEQGVCSGGYRYVYELFDGNDEVHRSWSTSCGTREGSFAGTPQNIRRLFQDQITGYTQFVSGIKLL